jgi:AcrR family transcriptional regulator
MLQGLWGLVRVTSVDRRADLADRALDYVLAHGLLGMSLRPLAAALGTSDRMLLYHFGTKEQLVGEILSRAQQRLAAELQSQRRPPPGLHALVSMLWADLSTPRATQVTRLYLETCLLASQDPGQWADAAQRLRQPWREPLTLGLLAHGVTTDRAPALADLILATLDGLALDRLTSDCLDRVDAAAASFADLVAREVP